MSNICAFAKVIYDFGCLYGSAVQKSTEKVILWDWPGGQ